MIYGTYALRSKRGVQLLMLAMTVLSAASFALESGAPIPAGTESRRGPLAAEAIISEVLGAAYVSGAEKPDLFVRTGRFGANTGLFLYPWSGTTSEGVPVFKAPLEIGFPFDAAYPPAGCIHQTPEASIHAVWIAGTELVHTVYDKGKQAFVEAGRIAIEGLPRNPSNLTVLENPDNTVEVLLEIGDGAPYMPADFSGRDARYQPYDGAGLWRGGYPYASLWALTLPEFFEGPAENPRQISATAREVRHTYSHLAVVDLGTGHERDVIGGSLFGNFYYYRNRSRQGIDLDALRYAVNERGIAHRHPLIDPGPVAYPNGQNRRADLIAGGEGGLYWYQFTDAFTDNGSPVYRDPMPVLQEDALLFGGSLPVPNVVDWDGDGAMDIVSGNSEGRVLFFRNAGSNAAPAFLPGTPVAADGHAIHVQPGYRLDIQGPGEARWGYTCPAVADWNGDGLPDLLMSDSTARHTVLINRGTATAPALERGHPLYYDGLDLYGTWRVKPAVAPLDGHMAYVALDEDDEFHLYWRVDDYNVRDGGKLRLDSGAPIRANFLHAGGTGRLKLNLADWDRDGLVDLIVGTPRHGSVPDPEKGLPQSLGLPGSAVLFLRNTGTNAAPVFQFPKLMAFHGDPLFLGQHACGPAIADFGGPEGPDLIVGEEGGRFLYYHRADLSLTESN